MQNELPKRKDIRLKGFDYGVGAYFITICTQNRRCDLSAIVGEGSPLPHLSHHGKIVENLIQQISRKYPEISIDKYVIMPNHIHLLLSITLLDDGRGNPSPTLLAAIGWFKFQATKEINRQRGTIGEKVFQRSFYDHVIRNQKDYDEIYKYICENPLRWQEDTLYAEE